MLRSSQHHCKPAKCPANKWWFEQARGPRLDTSGRAQTNVNEKSQVTTKLSQTNVSTPELGRPTKNIEELGVYVWRPDVVSALWFWVTAANVISSKVPCLGLEGNNNPPKVFN